MTQFRSRPPLWQLVRWDGVVVDTFETRVDAEQAAIYWTGSHVRQVTHSRPVNPILTELRQASGDVGLSWPLARLLDALTDDVRAPEVFRAVVRDATTEQREHALRVIRKLDARKEEV